MKGLYHAGAEMEERAWGGQVRETLVTSALLRLPSTMDRSDKELQVEKILEELVRSPYVPAEF